MSIYGNFSGENKSVQPDDSNENEKVKLANERQNNTARGTKTLQIDTNKNATEIYSAMVKMLLVYDHSVDKSRFQNFCLFLVKNTNHEESLKVSTIDFFISLSFH